MRKDTSPSLRLAKSLTSGFDNEPEAGLYGDEPCFYRPWQETMEGAAERFRATIALTPLGHLMYPTKENLWARDLLLGPHPLDNVEEIAAMQSISQFFPDGSADKASSVTVEATAKAPAQESYHGIELVARDSHPRVRHHEPEHSNFCPWPRQVTKFSKLRRPAV